MRRIHGGMKARVPDNGTWQEMSGNDLPQRLGNPIQSQALTVLGRASRHAQPALREGPPAKSLHRPPLRRRQQSSILPLPPPRATAAARDAERTGGPQGYGDPRTPPSPACPMEDQHQPRPPTLSLHETIRTVQQLSSGKAPASDAAPAEVYKHDGPQFMEHLTALFQEMWRQGEIAQDFKDTTIIHLYKRIGNHQFCDIHRASAC
ncbi:hypothetical protein SprV_0401547100 [Sparganum proliferum]